MVQILTGKRKTADEGGNDERGVRMIGDAARQVFRQSDGGDSRPAKRMSGEGVQDSSRIADRLSLPRADGRQAPLHLQVRQAINRFAAMWLSHFSASRHACGVRYITYIMFV